MEEGDGVAMESFFERMEPWRKPEGSLHLYIVFSDDELERFAPARQALASIDHLPLMPEPYLHATVQRLTQFDDEVSQPDLSALGSAMEDLCSGLAPFTLEFGRPEVGDVAVVSYASPSSEWDELVQGCRSVVTDVWGTPPPSAPAGPHLSLAYANGAVADHVVADRLAGVGPLGSVRVATVHLVSVTMRPERGTFDFTSLANWDISGT